MHTEEKMGMFFGAFAIFVAIMFMAIALVIARASQDGVCALGYIAAAAGWWLVGVSLMAAGKDRARIDGLQQQLATLTNDRSAE